MVFFIETTNIPHYFFFISTYSIFSTFNFLCCAQKLYHNPLSPSVEYFLHFINILILKIRRDHQKNSYERRAYESVDVRSLFCVISHRSAESSITGLKGTKNISLGLDNERASRLMQFPQ